MTENAKKVFEMLGVEPNEEFEIEDKNGFWKISERLNLYYRQGHYDNGDYAYNGFDNSLIIDLIKNPKLIIKLPKESKKKKLRDLTEEEFLYWKRNNCGNCKNCIFRNVICTCAGKYESLWVECKELYSDTFLNQEIEVEE